MSLRSPNISDQELNIGRGWEMFLAKAVSIFIVLNEYINLYMQIEIADMCESGDPGWNVVVCVFYNTTCHNGGLE